MDDTKPSKLGSTSEQELARQAQAQWEHHQAYMNDPNREARLLQHKLRREAEVDEILHRRKEMWKRWIIVIVYGLCMLRIGYVLGTWYG